MPVEAMFEARIVGHYNTSLGVVIYMYSLAELGHSEEEGEILLQEEGENLDEFEARAQIRADELNETVTNEVTDEE